MRRLFWGVIFSIRASSVAIMSSSEDFASFFFAFPTLRRGSREMRSFAWFLGENQNRILPGWNRGGWRTSPFRAFKTSNFHKISAIFSPMARFLRRTREKVSAKKAKINFQFLLLPKDQRKINALIQAGDDTRWIRKRKGKLVGKWFFLQFMKFVVLLPNKALRAHGEKLPKRVSTGEPRRFWWNFPRVCGNDVSKLQKMDSTGIVRVFHTRRRTNRQGITNLIYRVYANEINENMQIFIRYCSNFRLRSSAEVVFNSIKPHKRG